jgi:hypothetical protein
MRRLSQFALFCRRRPDILETDVSQPRRLDLLEYTKGVIDGAVDIGGSSSCGFVLHD